MKPPVPPPLADHLKFLSPFQPKIRDLALDVRRLVLEEAPQATELIYDAYNAVATGYSFTGRPGDSFIHIAVYAHWVNLGFNRGAEMEDPSRLLQGSGRQVRHIRISEPQDVRQPILRAFVRAAVARAVRQEAREQARPKSVVRAIYPKKRRPAQTHPK